jgi:hypothetical protein
MECWTESLAHRGKKFCRNQRILLRHNGGLLNRPPSCPVLIASSLRTLL